LSPRQQEAALQQHAFAAAGSMQMVNSDGNNRG
jgi:hypothetical protein